MQLGDILSICFHGDFMYIEAFIKDNDDKDVLRHSVIKIQRIEDTSSCEVFYLNKERSLCKTEESWLAKIEETNNIIKSEL